MCEEASNFTAEMAGNIPGERRVHNGFSVESRARDFDASLISPPSGSKDQQSMALTSNGSRHQRMELSVRTAIRFYFVQDMLGFDQPSQAVEWLIEKSEAAIRELPQPSSQYVVSNRAAVSSSCVETGGDLNTSSQDDTLTDSENRDRNLDEQILGAARSCRGQKSCTAKTTKSKNNIDSNIGEREKRSEQRSMAMRSVASNRRTRETANVVPPREFRAKTRERCRQRTKPKDKNYKQQSGISGISQKSSVRPHYPTFCLQENTTPPSSVMNETTDANSSSNAFMLPQDSTPCNQTGRC